MKITEIEWIKQNKHKLTEVEINALHEFGFFEQVEQGELSLKITQMLLLMELVTQIHQNHTKK